MSQKHFHMLNEDNFIHNLQEYANLIEKMYFELRVYTKIKVHSFSRYCEM